MSAHDDKAPIVHTADLIVQFSQLQQNSVRAGGQPCSDSHLHGPSTSLCYWKGCSTVVVLPSLSFDVAELARVKAVAHYEERSFWHFLMLLHAPHARVICVTSVPVDAAIVDYYAHLMRISVQEIRDRLILLSTFDSTPLPLTTKLLERTRLLHRIKSLLQGSEGVVLAPLVSTHKEVRVAKALGATYAGGDPAHGHFGTKHGSRLAFASSGVAHPVGTANSAFTPRQLACAIRQVLRDTPGMNRMVVKLNESFSGEGNAILSLHAVKDRLWRRFNKHQSADPPVVLNDEEIVRRSTDDELASEIVHEFRHMRFQGADVTWPTFEAQLPKLGAIAEEFVEGAFSSPSCQALIDSDGRVIILSTHEQHLGGIDGQVYLGCRFPADAGYRMILQKYTFAVGQFLSKHGCRDHFGVDFVTKLGVDCDPSLESSWTVTAIEINLRQGGTTHPAMTLAMLTGGHFDDHSGTFVAPDGTQKFYVCTDNLGSTGVSYRCMLPFDITQIFIQEGGSGQHLHFDHEGSRRAKQTGCCFHMLGALSQYGKAGVLCIENSPEQAQTLLEEVMAVLDEEACETDTVQDVGPVN